MSVHNELRKDYLLNRWVIIAAERAKRPTDYAARPAEPETGRVCPFCPGNERMTPPATLVYLPRDGGIAKERDSDGLRHRGWLVRCFANLYPALRPEAEEPRPQGLELRLRSRAVGFHQIIVESPNHDEHPGNARLSQLRLAFDAHLDLFRMLSSHEYVEYVQIFRNHGREAGASLSHAHTQVIATPLIPTNVMREIEASKRYHEEEGGCAFCKIVEEERTSQRLIYENSTFAVIAPWASVHPFEFWVLPKRHGSSLMGVSDPEKEGFVKALRLSLGGLARLLGDPPYNYGFHTSPKSDGEHSESYHWHLEVYPKLGIWAGFELSTGVYINVTPPEMAAESLRGSVEAEAEVVG
ncbi:MAG: galactose-1-phosphate uridylyltransferase [Candidatus Bathyarchaeia archaeon]